MVAKGNVLQFEEIAVLCAHTIFSGVQSRYRFEDDVTE